MRLYHFTNEKYGLEDLREKHLKVARISDLNDPTEFLAADLSNEEFRRATESMKESFSNDHGILCFSENWRSLMQWAHYADKHKGLCLGFDIPSHVLMKINYSEKRLPADDLLARQKILSDELEGKMDAFIDAGGPPVSRHEFELRKREFLEKECSRLLREHTEADQEGQDFMKKILTTKGMEWEYEKEYRTFVRLDSCEQVRLESCGHIKDLHFVKFPSEDLMLREVIVGYRCNVTCEEIKDALGEMTDCVTIRKARISRSEYAMVEGIGIPSDEIAAFCRRWQITRLALFGSILRDDFGPDSDIDVLVKFDETAHPTLFDMSRMEAELKAILGREVDLVSQRGIERSRNFLRRKAILESAELVYGS